MLIKYLSGLIILCFTFSACHKNTPYEKVNKLLSSKESFPHLVEKPSDFNKWTYKSIEEKFNHNFCEQPFRYLATIGKYENIKISIPLRSGSRNKCCIFRSWNFLPISINRQNKIMLDNRVFLDLKNLSSIRKEVEHFYKIDEDWFLSVKVTFDSTCSEKVLEKVLEEVLVGYYNYISEKPLSKRKTNNELQLMVMNHKGALPPFKDFKKLIKNFKDLKEIEYEEDIEIDLEPDDF